MAGIEQRPDGAGPGSAEQFHGLQDAVVLGDDVADPAERDFVQEAAGFVQVLNADVAERLDAQHLGAQLAGCAAGGVAAVGM